MQSNEHSSVFRFNNLTLLGQSAPGKQGVSLVEKLTKRRI